MFLTHPSPVCLGQCSCLIYRTKVSKKCLPRLKSRESWFLPPLQQPCVESTLLGYARGAMVCAACTAPRTRHRVCVPPPSGAACLPAFLLHSQERPLQLIGRAQPRPPPHFLPSRTAGPVSGRVCHWDSVSCLPLTSTLTALLNYGFIGYLALPVRT